MKKILIFGGAFDPIHQGHLLLLKQAQEEIQPQLTLVIPTGNQPVHKRLTFLAATTRLLLLKKALVGLKNTKILPYEIRQARPTYTWQTLRCVEKKWPRAKFYLLLGSDNIKTLASWRYINKILKNPKLTLVIGERKGFLVSRLPLYLEKARLCFLKAKFPAIASQKLRKNLPSLITNYIQIVLPPNRFRHTLACDKLALKLARTNRLNTAKTHLAALLHDASRTQKKFSSSQEALDHGPKSAQIAKEIFKISDPDILEAIRFHTTGKPRMSSLAQLLYVADFCAYDRKFKKARLLRQLAQKDLKGAMLKIAASKIAHLRKRGQAIHPRTFKFHQWLKG